MKHRRMQLHGEDPWREYVDSKGEGIHHVGFSVGDFDKEEARFKGSDIIHSGKLPNGKGAEYLDLKVGGIILELVNMG